MRRKEFLCDCHREGEGGRSRRMEEGEGRLGIEGKEEGNCRNYKRVSRGREKWRNKRILPIRDSW